MAEPSTNTILQSYVPPVVVRHLAQAAQPLAAPVEEQELGAVLFADISGWTLLTERLSTPGGSGAEDVTITLNAYFGRLISTISAHGGEVVKFAGDALLAFWPALPDLGTAALLAAQCGLAIQADVAAHERETAIQLKVIIGAGDVNILQLGGVAGRWECLVTGEPLVQVSVAEFLAEPGDVIISPEAWALIAGRAAGERLRAGTMRLRAVNEPSAPPPLRSVWLPPERHSLLRAYIPDSVLSRLDAGQADWLAELRTVSVLFCALPVSPWTPLEQDQAAMRSLQMAIERAEGTINKISIDEKGVTLVAAFGLPPRSHEDDGVRAVQAAWLAQQALQAEGIASSFGIATGRVFCGVIGTPERREYTVIGDAVNLAARLMAQALESDGSILCDLTTFEIARDAIAFEPLPPLRLKGKRAPVAVYRPRSSSSSVLQAPAGGALVGRRQERRLIGAALEVLSGGGRSALLFEGIGGIGKSRLVGEVIDQSLGRELRPLIGAGQAIETSTLYFAWRTVLFQALGFEAFESDRERRDHSLALFATEPELAALVPLLDDIIPIGYEQTSLTASMSGQVRAANLRRLVLAILERWAGAQPLVLIIEDTNWLDSASWGLVQAVWEQSWQLLLVLSARPWDAPPPLWEKIAASGTHVRLAPLERDDVASLMQQILGVGTVPESLLDLVHDKAEGHPFWSQEIIIALRSEGIITVRDNRCEISARGDDLGTVELPDTIQGIVTSRIDRLSPAQQLALKVASVIGRVFSLRGVEAIYPLLDDKPALPTTIATLASLDITPLQAALPEPQYAFKHAITHDVVYGLLPYAQRHALHRAIAEWYEAAYQRDLAPYAAALVHHWAAAGDHARLGRALELAGEHALHSGAYAEAARAFEQLLAGHGTAGLERARWRRQLGEALFGLGRITESRMALEQALDELGFALPPGQGRLALSFGQQIAIQLARRLRPPPPVEDERREHLLEAARIISRLWHIYNGANEAVKAFNAAWEMVNLAEPAGPSVELAQAYALICFLSMSAARVGGYYAERARATLPESADAAQRIPVLQFLGRYEAYQGAWAKGRAAFAEGLALAQQLGDHQQWEELGGDMGMADYHQALFDDGRAWGERIIDSAAARGSSWNVALGCYVQALNRVPQGDYDAAVPLLHQAIDALKTQPSDLYSITSWGLLAVAHWYRGAEDEAMAAVAEVQTLFRRSNANAVVGFGYPGIADVLLARWLRLPPQERPAEQAAVRQAVTLARRASWLAPIFRPLALRCQGLYLIGAGRPAPAVAVWEQGLRIAYRQEQRYEAVRLHALLAAAMPATEAALHARIAERERRALGIVLA